MDTQGTIGHITQGTNVQKLSLNEPLGHSINGQATTQKIPTALIINLDLAYVLWPTPQNKWIRVQEGIFLGCLKDMGALSWDAG